MACMPRRTGSSSTTAPSCSPARESLPHNACSTLGARGREVDLEKAAGRGLVDGVVAVGGVVQQH
eukprot:623963-Rhodomonas_salina.1